MAVGDGNGVLVGRGVAVGIGAEVGVGGGVVAAVVEATGVGDGAEVGAGLFSGCETAVGLTTIAVADGVLAAGSLPMSSARPLVIEEPLPPVPGLSFSPHDVRSPDSEERRSRTSSSGDDMTLSDWPQAKAEYIDRMAIARMIIHRDRFTLAFIVDPFRFISTAVCPLSRSPRSEMHISGKIYVSQEKVVLLWRPKNAACAQGIGPMPDAGNGILASSVATIASLASSPCDFGASSLRNDMLGTQTSQEQPMTPHPEAGNPAGNKTTPH